MGWDVGGWNCDKNGRSRDAIVILNSKSRIVGEPWRGNLCQAINESANTPAWIAALFRLCGTEAPDTASVTLAIDTPLGFSEAFLALVGHLQPAGPIGESHTNLYLFRQTERYLFERGLKPLSAIKDMIGSQATKGIHALSKFAPCIESCGVWTDRKKLRAIETYPSGCRHTPVVKARLKGQQPLAHDDLDDARVCAVIACLFATHRSTLNAPLPETSSREGWIWLPKELAR